MLNINFLKKRSSKILLSINQLIESFFNRIKVLVNLRKKKKFNLNKIDKKITIVTGSVVILFFFYFLIPTFYDKNLVKTKLENQALEEYNLEVKFEGDIDYRLLPKPHFFSKKAIITHNDNLVAVSNYSRTYLSLKNFFSFRKLKIKNLLFKKTEFNIDSNNFDFFEKMLNSKKSKYGIKFKNSILFYKNRVKDVILIVDLDGLNFFKNKDLNQQLDVNYKIFNLPFNFTIENDQKDKKVFSKLNSHKIRLKINNDFNYNNEKVEGLLDFKIINRSKQFKYQITENFLNFRSDDKNFYGDLAFKPFYLSSHLNFNELDIIKLFEDNSIFLNLLNSEILNNQNLNAQINLNFDKIKSANYLSNIFFKTSLEEGSIVIKSSAINWNDSILIDLNDSQLINEKDKLTLVGTVTFNFTDIARFYSHYQIKRNYRRNIKKVKLDFLLNLDEKKIQFDNLKIDGVASKNVDGFLNELSNKNINIFNKVFFKNLIKQFFSKYYEG